MEINYSDFQASFLTVLAWDMETIEINIELNRRYCFDRGIDKYKQFSINQLLSIRNKLHSLSIKESKRLYERERIRTTR